MDLQFLINKLNKDGYVILEKCISNENIELILRNHRKFISKYKTYDPTISPRIVNLHIEHMEILNIFKDANIEKFLNMYFLDSFTIYTSLFFKYPTQQPLHIDSPVFHTYPQGQFIGFWISLENAGEHNGQLELVPKSHLYPYLSPKKYIDNNKILPNEVWAKYQLDNYKNLKKIMPEFEIKKINTKKGDIVIWHGNLLHGGSKALSRNMTRESMVFHITAYNKQVYQLDEFFNEKKFFELKKKMKFSTFGGVSYFQTNSTIGKTR